jgi:hypothetical protein
MVLNSKFYLYCLGILGLTYFIQTEVCFLLMAAVVFILYPQNKIQVKGALRILYPILIVLLIGLVGSTMFNFHDVLRDLYLSLKIVVCFLVGALAIKYINSLKKVFSTIHFCAFIYSLIHIFKYLFFGSAVDSYDTLRAEVGRGNLIEALSLAIFVVGRLKIVPVFSNIRSKFMALVVSLSFILYYSRSLYVAFFIFLLFLTNTLNIRSFRIRINVKYIVLLIIGLCLIIPVLNSKVNDTSSPISWLIFKFSNISNEVSWDANKNVVATEEDINVNWRGYESYQGMLKFYNGTIIQKAIGYGWGSLVDLGLAIKLGSDTFDEIPILHNGFVMILVKCGILGLILYSFFLVNLSIGRLTPKGNNHATIESLFFSQLLSAICIITLINSFTITGLFNQSDMFSPLSIGFCWAFMKRNEKI